MLSFENYLSAQMLINSKTTEKNLSYAQLKVHNYIMAHANQVIYTSLAQLSSLTGVGEATIIRYCQKLGFDGYTSYKLELLKIVTNNSVDETASYVDQISNNMIESIHKTKSGIVDSEINKACELIEKANEIVLIGQGLSFSSALDTYSRLIRIGLHASIMQDSHFAYMKSSLLTEKDVILCYSFSGETYEVLRTVKIAKKYGAKVIAITNHITSELADLADVNLITNGLEKNISGGSFSNKISQYFVSDILITKLSLKHLKRAKEAIEKTTSTVMNLEDENGKS